MQNEKKQIITIAGKLGSGKSSTAKAVAKRLGYTHYSTGDFAREVAKEHGLTITEWNQKAEENPELDHEVDKKTQSMRESNEIVIDSRIAFHWIPESFKVFLDIDDELAAQRIFKALKEKNPARATELQAKSWEELVEDMRQRVESERKRYQELYGIDHMKPDNFDLILDTGDEKNDIHAVVTQLVTAYESWLQKT